VELAERITGKCDL